MAINLELTYSYRHMHVLGFLAILAIHAGAKDSAAEQLPVVFVPGTAGSQLSETAPDGKLKPLWLSMRLTDPTGGIDLTSLGPGGAALVADDLLRHVRFRVRLDLQSTFELLGANGDSLESRSYVPVTFAYAPQPLPVYGRFLDWVRNSWLTDPRRKLWYSVPYDWRKGACQDNADAIDRKVREALDTTGAKQVILLAHSLGGLVCRDYITRGDNASKVRALIAVGTPWLGAPKAARGLRWGYNFGLGGKLEPIEKYQVKGIYIYDKDPSRADPMKPGPVEIHYLTLVSLLDPDRTKAVAQTFPCVFQQLPTDEYMALYGRALGRGPTSPFADHQETGDTIAIYRGANQTLYNEAVGWHRDLFKGGSRGVRHYLIAGTLDEGLDKDAPELSMEMRLAREGDPFLSWYRTEAKIPEQKGTGFLATSRYLGEWTKLVLELMSPDKDKLDDFKKILLNGVGADTGKEILNAFFDINPFLRDMGNRNWHILRQNSLELINSGNSPLRLYPEITIPVHRGAEWGDGTAPLLSATAGARLRANGVRNEQEAKDRLGEETMVDVVRLGKEISPPQESVSSLEVTVLGQKLPDRPVKRTPRTVTTYYDHAGMLDDSEVQKLIRKRYEEACSAER
ncbi:MAG: esterase/lipase family protein [Isosphaeraceae bacterium]